MIVTDNGVEIILRDKADDYEYVHIGPGTGLVQFWGKAMGVSYLFKQEKLSMPAERLTVHNLRELLARLDLATSLQLRG